MKGPLPWIVLVVVAAMLVLWLRGSDRGSSPPADDGPPRAPVAVAPEPALPIDPHVRQVPPSVRALKSGPAEPYLEALVGYLVRDAPDAYTRARRIHDWIADNIAYDADGYFSGSYLGTEAESTLASGKAVCAGYAGLFERMARIAGFEVEIVSGHGRGIGFDVFDDTPPSGTDHAWNRIKIDGEWRLVDTTWDAGHIKGRGFVRDYATDYLFPPSEAFLHTHWPEDPADQLLDPPRTAAEFMALPYLRGVFFERGLRLVTAASRVQSAAGGATVEIDVPGGLYVSARVESADGRVAADRELVTWHGARARVHAQFPELGNWKLTLFAGPAGETAWSVGTLGYRNTVAGTARYPETTSTYSELRAGLIEPLDVDAARRARTFRIRVPGIRAMKAIVDGKFLDMKRDGEEFSVVLPRPALSSVKLSTRTDPADSRWWSLVHFRL